MRFKGPLSLPAVGSQSGLVCTARGPDNLEEMRVLVIEDERRLAENVARSLKENAAWAVDVALDGQNGLHLAESVAYDLIVLDLMLPKMDGLELLRRYRRQGNKTPVLVLTARDTLEDRLAGLRGGADDYLIKPFAFAEVLARIQALVRRGRATETIRLSLADLAVDLVRRKVTRGGRVVELTVREYELLEYLLRHQGHIVSREALARDVWKEASRTTTLDNVVDVHMTRLRRKIDLDQSPKLIHTVRGVGFVAQEGEP